MRLLSVLIVVYFQWSFVAANANENQLCTEGSRNSNYKWSPYYQILLQAIKNETETKGDCHKEISTIINGLDQKLSWALKAFDASGSPETTFIYGQIFWQGSQVACELLNSQHANNNLRIPSSYKTPIVTAIAPFTLNYMTIYAAYTTRNQYEQYARIHMPLQLGVCVPESCRSEQIFELASSMFAEGCLPFQQIYNVTIEIQEVKTTSTRGFMQQTDALIILIIVISVLIFVAGMNFLEKLKLNNEGALMKRVAKCFNLKNNLKHLMNPSLARGSVAIVDAIKVLACISIMIVHLPIYSLLNYENYGELLYFFDDPKYLFLTLGLLSVDVFFVLSAFLLAYNFFQNSKLRCEVKKSGIFHTGCIFSKHLIHRYLRLTPPFLLIMSLTHLTALYMKEAAQSYVPKNLDIFCSSASWWHGILYVHSFYSINEMCATWTWYLSAEMFYFVVTLAGLFTFAKNPALGKIVFFSLLTISLVFSTYQYYKEKMSLNFADAIRTIDTLYIAPFVRMNSCFAGVLGGYFADKFQDSSFKISAKMQYIWISVETFSMILAFLICYFSEILPTLIFYSCFTVGRFYFGCLIVWSILMYNFSLEGALKRFLSNRIFLHLSKLSYMMYLLYPLLVYFYRFSNGNASIRAHITNIYVEGFGLIVFCYFLSTILCLFFEIPFYRLSSEFLIRRNSDTRGNNV